MEQEIGHHTPLIGVAVVALVALACGILMRRLKQPAILGYIIAGLVLGPAGAALVEDIETIQFLAELGVLMLLYLIGMELSLKGLREVWKIALVTTLAQIAAGLGFMWLLGSFLDWSLALIVTLGFTVALSSTAVAIKLLGDIGELRSRVGTVTVSILIAQDLAVVPMMLLLGSLKQEASELPLSMLKVALSIGFLVLMVIYLSRRHRIRLPFAQMVGDNIDLTPLAGLAFCFGAAALSGWLGLSTAYGAFIAGLVVGNSTSRATMISHTAPIQSVLLMVFFLSIGLLIDLPFLTENWATLLAIVAFVAIGKTALNIVVIRLGGETWPHAFLSGAALAQLGEFGFILAALGLQIGALDFGQYRLIVAATALSLVFSPLWLEASRRLHRVALLGVTSGSETVRLTLGAGTARVFERLLQGERRLVDAAAGAGRKVGTLMPRGMAPTPPQDNRPRPPTAEELARSQGRLE